MHFMNPVPVMKLVELIRGMQTSDEVMSHTGSQVAAPEQSSTKTYLHQATTCLVSDLQLGLVKISRTLLLADVAHQLLTALGRQSDKRRKTQS